MTLFFSCTPFTEAPWQLPHILLARIWQVPIPKPAVELSGFGLEAGWCGSVD